MRLSVLDQSPVAVGSTAVEALANTARLAQETERLGYHRFWVSEHHFTASLAGSSPEVLISHLAARTTQLRIGSGGVMLPHYSSYKVAENFRLLEALYPGRIDLGLGRAPGGMPLATRALQEGTGRSIDRYPEQLDDLIAYLHDALPDTHPLADLRAMPLIATVPELWLLGSSSESAKLAAGRGAGFAFAHFINGYGGVEEMRAYREAFRPAAAGDEPRSLVAIHVFCGETEEEAEEMASSLDLTLLLREKNRQTAGVATPAMARHFPYSDYDRSRIEDNRRRMIIGDQKQVQARLLELAGQYETDEIMIVTVTHSLAAKLKSYRLLAEVFGLACRAEEGGEGV